MHVKICQLSIIALLSIAGCTDQQQNAGTTESVKPPEKGSYGFDAGFMKKHLTHTLELHDSSGQTKVLLSPEYQGRVMTSTANGDSGSSFGWINYGLIETQKFKAQFNPVGGEERFWLGPEGGQFALYFNKGDSFNLNHWQVPPVLDTLPFELQTSTASQAVFARKARLQNYAGSSFDLKITRTIRLVDKDHLGKRLGLSLPADIRFVAFETDNQVKNSGTNTWKKETGLLSIWLLGMMTPTDQTFVFIPFQAGAHSREYITDNYFGKIPPDRLVVKDSLLFFRCDGKFRSKIGLSPRIAGSMAASFDFSRNVLSILAFNVDRQGDYVNSKWEMQKQPYQGDVVNAYNDGPLAGGGQLGPFYEIESSCAAKSLKPGESESHRQLTCHFQGEYSSLRKLAMSIFGIDLEDLRKIQ